MGDDPVEDYYQNDQIGSEQNGNDDIPPWEQESMVTCDGCARVIEPTGNWTVEKIVDYSKRKYGQVLCPECQPNATRGGAK